MMMHDCHVQGVSHASRLFRMQNDLVNPAGMGALQVEPPDGRGEGFNIKAGGRGSDLPWSRRGVGGDPPPKQWQIQVTENFCSPKNDKNCNFGTAQIPESKI